MKGDRAAWVLGLLMLPLAAVANRPSQSVAPDGCRGVEPVSRVSPLGVDRPEDVYMHLPFAAGERLIYRLYYSGIYVGRGELTVGQPQSYLGRYWMNLSLAAATGDWYRAVFNARDFAQSYSDPRTFAVAKFFIDQDERPLFGRSLIQKRWLTFDHLTCQSRVVTERAGHTRETATHVIRPGIMGTLSATLYLRTLQYRPGRLHRIPVYSSAKNWVLEVTPLAVVSTPLGATQVAADHLGLKSFIGEQWQQNGTLELWIAKDLPSRPILEIRGELAFGSVRMILDPQVSTAPGLAAFGGGAVPAAP